MACSRSQAPRRPGGRVPGGYSEAAAARSCTAAAAAASTALSRLLTVTVLINGCIGKHSYDARAFAFVLPTSTSTVSSTIPSFANRPPATTSSFSPSLVGTEVTGRAGGERGALSLSSDRLAAHASPRQHQQKRYSNHAGRQCSALNANWHASTTGGARRRACSALNAEPGGRDEPRADADDGWGGNEALTKSAIEEGAGMGRLDAEEGEDGVSVPEIGNPFRRAFDAGRNLRATFANTLEQITGAASPLEGVKIRSLEEYEKRLYSPFDTEEEVPTVLVVGATGEMGRVVVRKLLLRGFSVRVLVRNLYSSTLDLLGTGATFAQGDLTNYRSIVDAVSGVDKVIFCAQARDASQAEKVEYEGLRNLLAAFQDQRVALYGDPYSTKKTLFRFNRPADRELWNVDEYSQESAMWKENKFGYGTFASTRMYDSGYANVESAEIKLNLAGFSGLAIRCCGDGKPYRFILRDKQYETMGIQFETVFKTKPNKWQTHRLSFSAFDAYQDGEIVQTEAGIEVDRASILQLAIGYKREPVDPFNFVLSMHFVKVYRTQIEPEFVYVSSAGVPPITDSNYDRVLEDLVDSNPKCYYNARGEELLRKSGLTYTIIRVEGFNNLPGGVQAIEIKQNPENVSLVSRADAAEITVQCLLDPRACNLALYTTTSRRAPSASDPVQKMSTQLSRLRPNT